MKNSIISILVLLIITGFVLSFAKDNPGGKLLKLINGIKTSINTNITVATTTAKSIESCSKKQGVWYPESKVCEVNQLSEVECKTQGGEFNGCASACRHNPRAEMCTLQCVLTCTFK